MYTLCSFNFPFHHSIPYPVQWLETPLFMSCYLPWAYLRQKTNYTDMPSPGASLRTPEHRQHEDKWPISCDSFQSTPGDGVHKDIEAFPWHPFHMKMDKTDKFSPAVLLQVLSQFYFHHYLHSTQIFCWFYSHSIPIPVQTHSTLFFRSSVPIIVYLST